MIRIIRGNGCVKLAAFFLEICPQTQHLIELRLCIRTSHKKQTQKQNPAYPFHTCHILVFCHGKASPPRTSFYARGSQVCFFYTFSVPTI